MKAIKLLTRTLNFQYPLSKKGLTVVFILVRFFSRFGFINPLKRLKKLQFTREEELHKVAQELKPVLLKFSETLSIQPEVLHGTLKEVVSRLHDKISLSDNNRTITIIENNEKDNENSIDDPLTKVASNALSEDNGKGKTKGDEPL